MGEPSRHDKRINAAIWLAEQGALIGWASINQGKAVKRHWKDDLTDDPAAIKKALRFPAVNPLIVPTGQMVILDPDKAGGYDRLVQAGLPDTFRVETPTERVDPATGDTYHGLHVYGLAPDGYDVLSLPGTWIDGEVRRSDHGEQSMVLGPWAIRPDGIYTPVPDAPRRLAVYPASVLDYVRANPAMKPPVNGHASSSGDDWVWNEAMGSRHDHLRDRIRFWVGNGIRGEPLRQTIGDYIDRHSIPLDRPGGEQIDGQEIERMVKGAEKKFSDDPPNVGPTLTLNPKPATTIGTRTANDLPIGPPPDLIVDGFLLPNKTTLMYGTGGTGKGVLAAIFAAILIREYGKTVGVIDYEDHPEEWGSRLDGVTFADGTRLTVEEKARIHYRSPYDLGDWTGDTGSLHVVAMALRADFDAVGVDYVIVDSYSAATDGDEGLGGQRDAKNFGKAMTQIGRPGLVLAHVAATTERLPDKPFGSVHVRNLVARLMYALAQDAQQDDALAPTVLIGPTTIRIEAKRTKGNQYGRRANRWIEITFGVGGAITWDLDAKAVDLPLWQQVEAVLLGVAPEPLSPEAITKAVNEDYPRDRPPKVNHIRDVLSRRPDVFVVVDDSVRPKTWSVRGSRAQHQAPLRGGADAALVSAAPAQHAALVSAASSAARVSTNAASSAASPENDLGL